jgi:mediator of RNA polymerase II transcription subunit 25
MFVSVWMYSVLQGAMGTMGMPVRERHTIWQGVLEWLEKAKNPNDNQKITKQVPCQVSSTPKEGEPDL